MIIFLWNYIRQEYSLNLTELEKFYQDDAYCGFSNDLSIERYSEYANYVQRHTQGKVYELGSGLGLAAIILKKAGIDIVATDIFPQNAIKTFKHFNQEISIEEINLNSINKSDSSVENYCLYQVMEHVENPQIAINEIYRTLKPNGVFILVGPNLISPLTSLKCLVMAITGKWKTPWFKRKDQYIFPLGGTVLEIIHIFFRNLFLSLLKTFVKSSRKIIFRTPCLQKPAISDSDAVNLLNPFDMKEILEKVGFTITSYQDQRKFKSFSGSTWIVAKKIIPRK